MQRARSARNLGFDATPGRKRRLTFATKRRQQAYARLHKLSNFQGLEHRRKLHSTIILLRATCDTAVMGMAPHLAQKLRAQTIDSLGVLRGGRCASTAMLSLLKQRDPFAQAVLALVHIFLASWHLYPRHHSRLICGWKRVAKRFANIKPRARWRCATGCMAALQLCLHDLGWKPLLPNSWIRGLTQMVKPGPSRALVLPNTIWASVCNTTSRPNCGKKASLHQETCGPDPLGTDLTAVQKVLAHLRRKENHREAGALITPLCVCRHLDRGTTTKAWVPDHWCVPQMRRMPRDSRTEFFECNQNALHRSWVVNSQHLCQ